MIVDCVYVLAHADTDSCGLSTSMQMTLRDSGSVSLPCLQVTMDGQIVFADHPHTGHL